MAAKAFCGGHLWLRRNIWLAGNHPGLEAANQLAKRGGQPAISQPAMAVCSSLALRRMRRKSNPSAAKIFESITCCGKRNIFTTTFFFFFLRTPKHTATISKLAAGNRGGGWLLRQQMKSVILLSKKLAGWRLACVYAATAAGGAATRRHLPAVISSMARSWLWRLAEAASAGHRMAAAGCWLAGG